MTQLETYQSNGLEVDSPSFSCGIFKTNDWSEPSICNGLAYYFIAVRMTPLKASDHKKKKG